MSDIAKWALLVAGIVAVVALILSTPLLQVLNIPLLSTAISMLFSIIAPACKAAMGFFNFFMPPEIVPLMHAVLVWLLLSPLFLFTSKLILRIYRWIFK